MMNNTYPFALPPLPYAPEALEPHVDARTMRIHHDEHHRVYVEKLNAALKDHPQLHGHTIEDLLRSIDRMPEGIRTAVRNNGGGHLNHSLLWSLIAPPGQAGPTGTAARSAEGQFRLGRGHSVSGSLKSRPGTSPRAGHFSWPIRRADAQGPLAAGSPVRAGHARDGASRLRRLGTRVLPEAPESAGRVPGVLVGGGELAGGRTAVRPAR